MQPLRLSATAPISLTSLPMMLLTDYRNESYTKALTDLVNTYKPEILLLGATTLGRDLAGAVATTLLTGLTADCTDLDVDADGSLAATRPTFGGSLCAPSTRSIIGPRWQPCVRASCRCASRLSARLGASSNIRSASSKPIS